MSDEPKRGDDLTGWKEVEDAELAESLFQMSVRMYERDRAEHEEHMRQQSEPKRGDFGQALRWLKAGKRVRLPEWRDDEEGSEWITLDGSRLRIWWLYGAASEEWEPVHADLLREDWEVCDAVA